MHLQELIEVGYGVEGAVVSDPEMRERQRLRPEKREAPEYQSWVGNEVAS